MSILSAKLNKAQTEKRLRKEARLLYTCAESTYWAELEKDSADRDNDLLAECLETMKYSKSIIASEKGALPFSFGIFMRRTAAVLGIILAFAVVSCGVCYAFGIDVWEYFVHGDKNSLTIEGVSNSDMVTEDKESSFENVQDTQGYISCDTLEEAEKRINLHICNLDLTKQGKMIDNIYVFKDSNMKELSVEYSDGTEYVVTEYRSGDTAFVSSLLGDFETQRTLQCGEITVYVAEGDINAFCYTYGGLVYQIYTDIDVQIVLNEICDMNN